MSDINSILENFHRPTHIQCIAENKEPFAMVPDGHTLQSLEQYLDTPVRINEITSFDAVNGFCDYIKKFKGENTVLFASERKVTAIFDYHIKDLASWCKHRAIYKLQRTPEWSKWEDQNQRDMRQRGFLNFLEDVNHTIMQPSGAEILTLIRALRATVRSEQVQIVDEDGQGTEVEFKRKAEVKAANNVHLPREITVRLVPYLDVQTYYDVQVRLDVSVDEESNSICFSYRIVQFDQVKRQAFEDTVRNIAETTKTEIFVGADI